MVVSRFRLAGLCLLWLGVVVAFGCTPAAPGNAPPEPAPDTTPAAYPYQVHAELARVFLKYNVLDESLRHFEAAINTQARQTDTEDAELWAGLGEALQRSGREAEAVTAYRRALTIYEALHSRNADAAAHNLYVQRIAALHTVLGNPTEAAAWRGKLYADENSAGQQLALAMIHESQQNLEQAEVCYRRALTLTEGDAAAGAEVRLGLAAMLHRTKRDQEAEALAREVIASDAGTEFTRQARRLLFDIYEARGELDKLDFK